MSRQKKNRRIRRMERQALRDYNTLMKGGLTPSPNFPLHEWSNSADFFVKFTLYDESQISYTSSGTSYVTG